MPGRTIRARLVLLDADVIIELFRQGIWDALVSKVQVFVTPTVVKEVRFYPDPASGQRRRVDLQSYVDDSRIHLLDAEAESLDATRDACGKCLAIHPGELYSLAALKAADNACKFCTADKAAIQALVLLDMTDRAVSMERMLGDAGVGRKQPLARQFDDEYLQKWLRSGAVLKAGSAAL